MALDPEELKRRKQQRMEARQRQKARQRKLLIRLAIAGGALILCGVILFAVIASVNKEKEKAAAEALKGAQTTTIRLAAAGDLNITGRLVSSESGNVDYDAMFMDVAHLLADADITVMNLEGVACGEPYGESRSTPQAMLKTLDMAGVDFIQLANSYAIHKGVYGLATTIDTVRASGMEPLGVYKDTEEREKGGGFTLCEVKGIKLAFVAFTKGMNGMALPAGSEACVNLLYKDYSSLYQEVDVEGITRVMDAVAEENPDIVVALVHWGSENNDELSNSQKEIEALLLEKGTDAIIGTHPHRVQKVDYRKGTKQLVAYSLGDFVSGFDQPGSEYSIILNLEITKNNVTGETWISSYDYTPIYTVNEEGKQVRVLRIQEAKIAYESGYIDRVTEETYLSMKNAEERIAARIKGE